MYRPLPSNEPLQWVPTSPRWMPLHSNARPIIFIHFDTKFCCLSLIHPYNPFENLFDHIIRFGPDTRFLRHQCVAIPLRDSLVENTIVSIEHSSRRAPWTWTYFGLLHIQHRKFCVSLWRGSSYCACVCLNCAGRGPVKIRIFLAHIESEHIPSVAVLKISCSFTWCARNSSSQVQWNCHFAMLGRNLL